jgi:hypothetical protein
MRLLICTLCLNSLRFCLQEWIERYKDNRAAAAAELMTLLVQVRSISRLLSAPVHQQQHLHAIRAVSMKQSSR